MKSLMEHLFTHTPVKANISMKVNKGRPRPALRKSKSYNPLAFEPKERKEVRLGIGFE